MESTSPLQEALQRVGGRLVRIPEHHVAAGYLDDLDQLAEDGVVRLELLRPHEAELAGVHEEHWDADGLGRRRRCAELAVTGDDRAAAVAIAKEPVTFPDEVLPHVLLEERKGRRIAEGEPFLDRRSEEHTSELQSPC